MGPGEKNLRRQHVLTSGTRRSTFSPRRSRIMYLLSSLFQFGKPDATIANVDIKRGATFCGTPGPSYCCSSSISFSRPARGRFITSRLFFIPPLLLQPSWAKRTRPLHARELHTTQPVTKLSPQTTSSKGKPARLFYLSPLSINNSVPPIRVSSTQKLAMELVTARKPSMMGLRPFSFLSLSVLPLLLSVRNGRVVTAFVTLSAYYYQCSTTTTTFRRLGDAERVVVEDQQQQQHPTLTSCCCCCCLPKTTLQRRHRLIEGLRM